jgi:hypothetical protein
MQESTNRRITTVQAIPGKNISKTTNSTKKAGGMAQEAEYLPSKVGGFFLTKFSLCIQSWP